MEQAEDCSDRRYTRKMDIYEAQPSTNDDKGAEENYTVHHYSIWSDHPVRLEKMLNHTKHLWWLKCADNRCCQLEFL